MALCRREKMRRSLQRLDEIEQPQIERRKDDLNPSRNRSIQIADSSVTGMFTWACGLAIANNSWIVNRPKITLNRRSEVPRSSPHSSLKYFFMARLIESSSVNPRESAVDDRINVEERNLYPHEEQAICEDGCRQPQGEMTTCVYTSRVILLFH